MYEIARALCDSMRSIHDPRDCTADDDCTGNHLMSVNIAVVPVAGLGTRLLPATKSQPKEMLPVGRKPVVQYVFEELTAAGMQRILFVTGPGKASIENHFDVNEELVQMLREKGREELLAALE